MGNLIKIGGFALLFTATGLAIRPPQEQRKEQTRLSPPVIISISPAEPTTKDKITFTVRPPDYSRSEIERISLTVDGKEVKTCLYPPCIYQGGPYREGSLSYEVKVYGHKDIEPWTGPRRIYVRKAMDFEPRRTRAIEFSKGRVNLMPLAGNENTRWSNGAFFLPFPGEESDSRGFACYRNDSVLEDDKVYSRVLLTHPEMRAMGVFDRITNQYLSIPIEFGRIMGIFRIKDLPEDAIFRAKVGFLKGAYQSDGVEFKVFMDRDPSCFAAKVCYYDGHLDDLEIDLDRFAGRNVSIVLQVNATMTSTQDWAVWVNPRIE